MHDPDASPFNALPPVVLFLAAGLALIEVAFQLGARGLAGGPAAVGWRIEAINALAFSPRLWDRMVEIGAFPPRELLRFVTYGLVHYDFVHMLFVAVFLLALGKLVAETFSALAVAVVLGVSSAFGALVYAALLDDPMALVGGFPAVYGLIGCYSFILWVGLGRIGQNRLRAFTLIGVLMGLQLIFGLLFGGSNEWLAELSGFAAGFALSPVLAPGGFRRLVARLRQR